MSSPVETPRADYPTLPPPGAIPPAPPPRPPKSPVAALLLSLLFPGVGQLYNGQVAKAFAFVGAFAACIYIIVDAEPLPFALFLPFIIFYGLIDAYRSASLINARGTEVEAEEPDVEAPVWGASLLGIGLLLLLNNLGLFRLSSLHRFWPVILMVVGGVFLYRAIKRGKGAGDGPVV
jgi:TM2 domain-containing membrane protein YozV